MAENTLVVMPVCNPLTREQVVAQKNLLQQIQKAVMMKDVHYGIIPGTKKPTLYKAGAEAILTTFHIAVIPDIEDLSTADCCRYRVTARGVMPDGHVIGAGIGECSTDEEKYRWRRAVCQEEFNSVPEDRRRLKFSSYQGKVDKAMQVRTHPADLANTALKMAKKRAMIDLTLTATAASDVFDQDIEDLPAEYVADHISSHGTATKPAVNQPKPAAKAAEAGGKTIPEGMLKTLREKIAKAGITEDAVCHHFQVASLELLPFSRANDAIKAVVAGQVKPVTAEQERPAEQPNTITDDGAPPPADDDYEGRPFAGEV
jgi:hypothetical protein